MEGVELMADVEVVSLAEAEVKEEAEVVAVAEAEVT